jgi:hypothetical protein
VAACPRRGSHGAGRSARGGGEVAAAPRRGAREEAITENPSAARAFRWIDLNIDGFGCF